MQDRHKNMTFSHWQFADSQLNLASHSTNNEQNARLGAMMGNFSSARLVRFILAPVLSLWVAGLGCMMGCEGFVKAAETNPGVTAKPHSGHKSTIVASGHACSSGHARAKNAGEARPQAQRTRTADRALITADKPSSGRMKGCPLAVSRVAVITKTRGDEANSSPALTHSTLPAENFPEQTAPLSIPPRLPNRGHTYLRCCVFLI